ncbi:50S ribosomal protein L30e [Sulfuracidifex tepidarius]|uniref:Large ribosomal subunit protein eL30 n=1 Tax=Sulfuracidifex tepidarius TaxID=1294262 RepID=A0A510E477_9CREN|nr:50S ribosomal protein L30e [Sulfuracidifex tepidarius]BBG24510.1 50S ribosomal protein L30e [Sulfuracidifex tepidarius]BBG27267.1 50S ribosomal protein L30e [Sulfuracidifex tepidarius]
MSQQLTFEGELKVLLKTGKVVIGSRNCLKMLKTGKLKMVVVASTLRSDIKDDIIYFAKISGIPFYEYGGSGWDLGTLSGKPFMVSAMGIEDEGSSRILEIGNRGE